MTAADYEADGLRTCATEKANRGKGDNGVEENNVFGRQFRAYDSSSSVVSARQKQVELFYDTNHQLQTFAFVQQQKEHWLKLDKKEMGVWEAAELLNHIVDDSDPDLDLPQIWHLLQTAESCREMHPEHDWLHLTGFIHDLGKVMLHPDFGELPQWATVGDTFPVGCKHDENIIYHRFFAENPDSRDARYNTTLGVYAEGCGLNQVDMSWGHDEYMYRVMVANGCTLPPEAHFIVRYHSFYALHSKGAYNHLLDATDRSHLEWLKTFNQHDLYTKSRDRHDLGELKAYYQGLITKYFPDTLRW